MAKLADLYHASQNKNARGFLDLLAQAEGVKHGYNTMFGNTRFDNLSAHPNVRKQFRQTDGKINYTTAAGRYQFTNGTWKGLAKQYGFRGFSPQEQDLGALALIAQKGALQDVLTGNYVGAIKKLGGVWASLPSSPYAQPKKTYAQLGLVGGQQPTRQAMPQAQARNAQQQRNAMLLVAQMGDYRLKDTGIGSGDHYDLRLARNADGTRGDINPYLNRFLVNGKGLNAYRQTGRYMEQRKGYRHEGVDYGINGSFGGDVNARKLYVNPQFGVKGMRSFYDKHGGGWVTQVHFDDDIKVNILHQNQQGVKSVMNAYQQGRQQYQARQQPQQAQTQSYRKVLSGNELAQIVPPDKQYLLNQGQKQPQQAQSLRRTLTRDELAQIVPADKQYLLK